MADDRLGRSGQAVGAFEPVSAPRPPPPRPRPEPVPTPTPRPRPRRARQRVQLGKASKWFLTRT